MSFQVGSKVVRLIDQLCFPAVITAAGAEAGTWDIEYLDDGHTEKLVEEAELCLPELEPVPESPAPVPPSTDAEIAPAAGSPLDDPAMESREKAPPAVETPEIPEAPKVPEATKAPEAPAPETPEEAEAPAPPSPPPPAPRAPPAQSGNAPSPVDPNGDELPASGLCRVCQRQTEFRCARCGVAFFCCRAHQRQAWATHKSECEALPDGPLQVKTRPPANADADDGTGEALLGGTGTGLGAAQGTGATSNRNNACDDLEGGFGGACDGSGGSGGGGMKRDRHDGVEEADLLGLGNGATGNFADWDSEAAAAAAGVEPGFVTPPRKSKRSSHAQGDGWPDHASGPLLPGAGVEPDPAGIVALCNMGFAQEAAEEALRRCGNNVASAAEQLIEHGGTPARQASRGSGGGLGGGEGSAGAAEELDPVAPPALTRGSSSYDAMVAAGLMPAGNTTPVPLSAEALAHHTATSGSTADRLGDDDMVVHTGNMGANVADLDTTSGDVPPSRPGSPADLPDVRGSGGGSGGGGGAAAARAPVARETPPQAMLLPEDVFEHVGSFDSRVGTGSSVAVCAVNVSRGHKADTPDLLLVLSRAPGSSMLDLQATAVASYWATGGGGEAVWRYAVLVPANEVEAIIKVHFGERLLEPRAVLERAQAVAGMVRERTRPGGLPTTPDDVSFAVIAPTGRTVSVAVARCDEEDSFAVCHARAVLAQCVDHSEFDIAPPPVTEVAPDPQHVLTLVGLGFNEADARVALRSNDNDVDAAANSLFS